MASFSNKVRERLVAGIKRFQPILSSAKARDGIGYQLASMPLANSSEHND